MKEAPLAFLDLETSGLDAWTHEILEAAAIVQMPHGGPRFEHRWVVRPRRLEVASPEALKINRYHERLAGHPDAVELEAFLADALPALEGARLVGSNVAFDERFLLAACHEVGATATWTYQPFELSAFAAGVLGTRRPLPLSHLTRRLRLKVDPAARHTALGDARLVEAVFEALRRRLARPRPPGPAPKPPAGQGPRLCSRPPAEHQSSPGPHPRP